MKVNIQYFALLQDEAGMATETIETTATQPAEVYEQLKERHDFSLGLSALSFAVNDQFVPKDHPLEDGDRLVFIPPVAGG